MGDCSLSYCEGDDLASFRCNECGNVYCSTHRLPENHQCSALLTKESDGKRFETGLADKKDGSSRPEKKQTSKRDIRHDPVEPKTVGTGKQPGYSSSPDTELKDRSSLKTSSSAEYRGLVKSITPFVVLLALVIVGGGIAMGQISAEEYLGPPGKQIDTVLRSVGPIGIFNESSRTPTTTPETTQQPTETVTPNPEQTATTVPLQRSRLERLIHIEINERRGHHGLSLLNYDADLREIARQHSTVMAEHNDIFHTQPDGDTRSDRYEAAGYNCRVEIDSNEYATGGENVAKSWYMATISSERGEFYFDSPQELATGIVNQWMNSTGHRENILRPYWNKEGIGVAVSEEDGNTAIYVTQNFC